MTHQPTTLAVGGDFKWNDLPVFTHQIHEISTAETDCFRLDLTWLKFCEPIGMACLAAGMHYLKLREQKCIEVIRPRDHDARRYLERLNLFDLLGEEDLYPYQRRDPSGRFVELTRLTSKDQVAGATTALCDVFCQKLGLDGTGRAAIDTILSEVTENVFHHAHSPTGAYICCQSYQDRLTAAIVDLGDGIRRRLSDTEALQKIVDAHGGPLKAAITPKVTSRPAHNSGYGLALTSGLIQQNQGVMGIHSQHDRLTQNGSVIGEIQATQRWPGTAICLTFSRNRPLDVQDLYRIVWKPAEEDDFDFLGK